MAAAAPGGTAGFSLPRARKIAAPLAAAFAASGAAGQRRIADWNVTNDASGRVEAFQTATYAVNIANGLSMAPDVLIAQELLSADGLANFLAILNDAPGSPGDWAAAPFMNGPDTDNGFFYRTSKVTLLEAVVVSHGGPSPQHPRDVTRYTMRPAGYSSGAAAIACYASHMKAGSTSEDQARRLVEAVAIRADAAALPADRAFLLAADLNMQSSAEPAYIELVGGARAGRFIDPIATPGAWNNNVAFRFVDTQDPVGPGGMDDRFDQVLVSKSLVDATGMDYLGDPGVPYNTVTWDDPAHSYRSWGNDGTSFNQALAVAGNTMVGAAIAHALRDAALNAGHLPVFLDLRVPPAIGADRVIDFGTVKQGAAAQLPLSVANTGDVRLWTEGGTADLEYTLDVAGSPPVLVVPGPGPFTEPAGGSANVHTVILDTSAPGAVAASIEIASNAPDAPLVSVLVTGEIIAECPADLDDDGTVAIADLLALLAAWGPCSGCGADLDGDGTVAIADLLALLAAWGPC